MKKIVLGILALFVVVGSASAVPSVDDRRDRCEKRDGWVWVPKTSACIEKYPCSSNNADIRNAYCINTLHYAEESVAQDANVRDKLLKKALGTQNITDVEFSKDNCVLVESWQLVGLYCHDMPVLLINYDGMYAEVPYGGDMVILTASGVACDVYGGSCAERGFEEYDNDNKMPCRGLDGAETCKGLASFVSDLIGRNVKAKWETLDDGLPTCFIEGTQGLAEGADLGG